MLSLQIPPPPSLSAIPTSTLYDLLRPIISNPRAKFYNWSKTFTCSPLITFEPSNVEECRLVFELAHREQRRVRIVGAGLSPSDVGCTTDFMLRTHRMNKIRAVDVEKCYVVAEAGITLVDLQQQIATYGLAMHNLGSISTQALGGVLATATHGTGLAFPVLPGDVRALTVLLASGELVTCSADERRALFYATLAGLGCTGLVVTVQLALEPAFRLREVQETVAFDVVVRALDEVVRRSEHVRLWWYPQSRAVRVSSADRTAKVQGATEEDSDARAKASLLRLTCASFASFWRALITLHLVEFLLFIARWLPWLTCYVARYALWMDSARTVTVDDSTSILNLNCRYPQYTIEWAIPYERAKECLLALREWVERELSNASGRQLHFPIEIRFSEADDIWMSPSSGRRTCWIGLIQYKPYGRPVRYRALFERFEKVMIGFDGRPHWAKPHSLGPAQLRRLYPKYDEFIATVCEVDPEGIFRNEYVRRHLFGEAGAHVDPRLFKEYTLK